MSSISTAQASKSFLSQCDDLLTRLILDYSVFGVPKLDGRATGKIEDAREPRMTDREFDETRELVRQLRKGAVKVDDALASLLKLTPVRNFVKKWEDEEAPGIFANHAKRYILALRPDSGISFHETDRYKNPRGNKSRKGKKPIAVDTPARRDPATFIEVGVFATRKFKKGEVVNLRGGIADLTEEEDDEMRDSGGRRDFSVLWSERKNCFCLLLGPARFVNHDCRNNVEFQLVGANMTFKVLEDIAKDEEIFTHYGDHYFDTNNAACLCATCEELAQGAFTSKKKVAEPKPRPVAAVPPSRRSHRSATLSAPDYNEARAQSAPVASGSGHSLTASRSVRSSGLTRSSSLSALAGGSSPRGARIRPPSSRIVPVRGEASAIEALRNKPRGVIQPKLPPPPGYADDYTWDKKKRVAHYIGPVVSQVEKKPESALSRSASAPSLASLGKRKRAESDSPAPPRSRGRPANKKESPAPSSPKTPRLAQVKLKAVRLGERMSRRLADATTASGPSARNRKPAQLQKEMGFADESDLSSLDDESEEEEQTTVTSAAEAPVDADSDEEADEAAVEQQLLSPQRSTSGTGEGDTLPLTASSKASISLVVSSSSSRGQASSSRSRLVDLSHTTSTPVEEIGTPSLHAASETGEEDEVLLCPVPDGKPALLAPAPSFYATGPSASHEAAVFNDHGSAAGNRQDFRFGRSDLDRGGNGSAGQGIGASGGSGGDEEDDGDKRPPKKAIPVDAAGDVAVEEEKDKGKQREEDGGQGNGEAIALNGGVSVALNTAHPPIPPVLMRADSLNSNDSRDAAAALLLLLGAPPPPTSLGTPPEEPPSRESPAPSQEPKKRIRRSEVAATSSAKRRGDTEPIGLARHASRSRRAGPSAVASSVAGAVLPAPETRRTRSQPIAGKLQDVLSAPETLAAIGGYDWAKGKYISTKEALQNPSEDPRPPPREPSESSTPTPPPAKRPRRRITQPASESPEPSGPSKMPESPRRPISSTASRKSAKRTLAAQSPAPDVKPLVKPPPTPLPSGSRSTRRSFPMANMKVADLVCSPAARQATGGWDPVLGKYVSAAHAAPTTDSPPLSANSRTPPASSRSAKQEQSSRPPLVDGKRATRRSFPMANTTVSDLVYSREARAAAGGWDPVLGKYVTASSAQAGPSSSARSLSSPRERPAC